VNNTIKKIIIIFITILVTFIITSLIFEKKIELIKSNEAAKIASLTAKIDQYDNSYNKILQLNNHYNDTVGKIFELLYHSSYPSSDLESKSDDPFIKVNFLINNIEYDIDELESINYFLQSREKFVDAFPFIWPIDIDGIPEITSKFGAREYSTIGNIGGTNKDGLHFHAGIDLKLDIGTPIRATSNGNVYQIWSDDTYLGQHPVYGNLIILKHDYGFETYYAHLDDIMVTRGEKVERGDIIGHGGNSGMSNGPHVHYEIRFNKVAWDPMIFLGINQ
jgi:murein DD-endopeptidase MepM/ murein hydrolase activator NlpD